MNRKLFLPFILLCAAALAGSAQEKFSLHQFGLKMLAKATAPDKSLDSAYVLQPRLKWMIATEGNTIHTGVDLTSDITVSDFTGNDASTIKGTMEIGMSNRLYKKVGLSAAYGTLGGGFGVELGKKTSERNTFFNIGTLGSFYGFQVQYYRTHQQIYGSLALEGFEPIGLSSRYPGEMRSFALGGFYAFNRHKFVLASAYAGRLLQRRSTGSWLVTAKYMQGDFSLDPEERVFTEQLKDLNRYSTLQFSLGGGYSFNWVLLHREPYDYDNWRGLRNLTMNATFFPMVSFLNHIQTEQGEKPSLQVVRYVGQPTLTPVVLGALCYAWSRYYLTVQATYSRFGFQGADTDVEQEEEHLRTKIRTQGVFYDLSAKLQFGVRF